MLYGGIRSTLFVTSIENPMLIFSYEFSMNNRLKLFNTTDKDHDH